MRYANATTETHTEFKNTILNMNPNNQYRREITTQRVNSSAEYPRQDQVIRDNLGLAKIDLLYLANLNYDSLTTYHVRDTFLLRQHEWERSNDCAQLQQTIQSLVRTNRLARINKVVCFGLGALADDGLSHVTPGSLAYDGLTRANSILKGVATACTQHAAVLTITAALEKQCPQEKIQIYALERRYRQQDIEVLKTLGIEVLNHEYGIQGFTAVDENTFVIAINTGNFIRQIIRETNRPAAIIWSSPNPDAVWQGAQSVPETHRILETEYDEYECAALKDAWEPGHESEVATTKGAPEFGQSSPQVEELLYTYYTGNSDTKKNISDMLKQGRGPKFELRKCRHLAEAGLFVRRERLDFDL